MNIEIDLGLDDKHVLSNIDDDLPKYLTLCHNYIVRV